MIGVDLVHSRIIEINLDRLIGDSVYLLFNLDNIIKNRVIYVDLDGKPIEVLLD